jgi:hypothetical protein
MHYLFRGAIVGVAAVLVFSLTAIGRVHHVPSRDEIHSASAPVALVGIIEIPGNPLLSSDIAWVDPGTRRFYLSDRSNFAVDVVDAEKDAFVGRVTGFAGPDSMTPSPPNGQGPNGILVTPSKKLWAGDGTSTVRVADVDPKSGNYLKIIQSITTALPECGEVCNRADEIAYDPADHIIVVANNEPSTPSVPHTRGTPYATFISADTYKVLGHVSFTGATGLEQPTWIPQLHSFSISVPGYRNGGGSNGGFAEIAILDPKAMKVSHTYKPGNCHASGETIGPSDRLIVSCGGPIIMNVLTGELEATISQIGGGDENWYNRGDARYYFTANDKGNPSVDSLGVIDAKTNTWLQNLPDPGGRQAVALAENNHIFTPVRVTPEMVSDPSKDNTTCASFGVRGHGCIAVFVHSAGRLEVSTKH